MSASRTHYAVIGARYGGKIMAAHLALMGYPVVLFDPVNAYTSAIRVRGGIRLFNANDEDPQGFAALPHVASRIQDALDGADVMMVVLPASAHRSVAQAAAPHLKDGQLVVLHPGRMGGAIEFTATLREAGCTAAVTVAEAETFLYAGRSDGPAEVRLFRIKEGVPLAALPATHTARALEALRPAFPQFVDGHSVLHTGLHDRGAIFHPVLTLLNAGRIEATRGDYARFFVEGLTSTVSRVLETLDYERMEIAAALGIALKASTEWEMLGSDAQGSPLSEAIHNHPGYYLEDVPMSLVPVALLAQQYHVATPGTRAIVNLACASFGEDYWSTGRTLDRLGLRGVAMPDLVAYVMEGRPCR